MGREATCRCRCGGEAGTVKALLESTELILRGEIRRRVAFDTVTAVRAEGDALRLAAGGEDIELMLGAAEAAIWARKLASKPPTLREKLGIGPDAPALVLGNVVAPELAAALDGCGTAVAAEAQALIAVAGDENQLGEALRAHATLPGKVPIWIIHGKGRSAAFGEAAVRAAMRAGGYIDTKVSAVSATLSATRYTRKAPPART